MLDDDHKYETDCSVVLSEVYLYLDLECSEGRRALIQKHLDECTRCLREYGIELDSVSSRQPVMPQRSSYHTENSVISRPIRLPWPNLRNRKSGRMVSEEASRNSSMGQATLSGTAGSRSGSASGAALVGTAWTDTASLGVSSAPGVGASVPAGGVRWAIFSSDWAIEASGAEMLGNWTRASSSAAIQKMWL